MWIIGKLCTGRSCRRRQSGYGASVNVPQVPQVHQSCVRTDLSTVRQLDRALYSRKEGWVQDCLAMIVGRIVYAGSKLALANQWKNTALWELSDVEGKVDVDLHCYLPMDRLLERQSAIQHFGGSSS